MNKQELIYKIEKLPYNLGPIVDTMKINRAGLIKLIEQLDEPQKPIVPQVVIDYYEFYRGKLKAFEEWFAKFEVECDEDFQQMDEVGKWLYDVDFETQTQRELALAMLIVNGSDAVEVEKEKRYTVKLKNTNDYLNETEVGFHFYDNYRNNGKFTRKEIEDAGFGEVFNSPLFEVEEVER